MPIYKEVLSPENIKELKELKKNSIIIQMICLTFIVVMTVILIFIFKNTPLQNHESSIIHESSIRIITTIMLILTGIGVFLYITLSSQNINTDIEENLKFKGTVFVKDKEEIIFNSNRPSRISYFINFDDWRIIRFQLDKPEWDLININQEFHVEQSINSTHFFSIESKSKNFKKLS